MRTGTRRFLSTMVGVFMLATLLPLAAPLPALADTTAQTLPFSQDWSNTGLITTNDDWSGVPGTVGQLGQDITTGTGVDPQTLVADSTVANDVDVIANQTTPNTFATGGVAEFQIPDPTIALNGSGTADAPHIRIAIDTTGVTGVRVAYTLRDLDGSIDNSVQPVALQYRVGGSGSWTNVPAGFVSDATSGPSLATLVTPVNVLLPAAVDNQPLVNVRVMTTNAAGSDEWVGIDDIVISNSAPPTGVGAASPSSVQAGDNSLLTVAVTPGTNPISTGLGVVGNLSSIGGSATQAFSDDGVSGGDVTAGDNVFTWDATVSLATSPGLKTLTTTITDAQARSSTADISLTVSPGDDPSGVGAATPSSVQPGGTSLLTVTVTPGANPPSTGLAVDGDLTSIGGSASQTFYDDGTTAGDDTAGDNVFSYEATVSVATPLGLKTIPTTISDDQSRSANAEIALTVAAGPGSVLISEVYGGGGNSGATFTNDFIELYNPGSTAVDLTGWSVQYAAAGGSTWQVTNLTGSIPPGRNYLVQEAQGTGGTVPLPSPNAFGTIPMSGTAGKVALVASTTALTGSCPTGGAIIDFVGYGAAANCFEGAGPTATLSNTTSAQRNGGGATDTNNNNTDFSVGAPDPHPTDVAPAVIATSPLNGATNVPVGANIDITFNEVVNVTGSWFTISCGTSGAHTATFAPATTVFTLDPDADFAELETCTVTIVAAQVTDQDSIDPPDNMAANYVFTFTTEGDVCTLSYTSIHTIQGPSGNVAAPFSVTTAGVVVGDFEGPAASGLQGFYIQEPSPDVDPNTSEGIFVFTGDNASAVNAGDFVRVTGTARERFNETAINGSDNNTAPVTNIVTCSTGSPAPAPTDVMLPVTAITDFEKYEGMLVNFSQSLVISEYFNYGRFGEIVLALPLAGESRPFTGTAIDAPGAPALGRAAANALRRITLDDHLASSNPDVLRHPNGLNFSLTNYFRGGDTVTNTTGVLGFAFSLYRIQPTAAATYAAVNPRPTSPEDPGGRLTVAAQNTLNFFLTLDETTNDSGPGPCGGGANLDCRGADSDQPDEFQRQRDKLVATLAGLGTDIIGLNEIENTPGVDPLGDPTKGIVAGLNGVFGAGTYDDIATGVIGTDAIRVGLVYRPGVVTPVGGFQVLSSADDPRFVDTKSRPSLAQTFMENATGEVFTVVVNHLKSKGSDCNDLIPPDPDAGDGQGNCNGTRELAAQALVDWLATDPTRSNDPDFLIIGDLNSYAMEDPITAIKAGSDDASGTGDDYTNLISLHQGTFAYSYTFDGQAGYLDHALASTTMTNQVVGAADWHNNSDEASVFDYDTTFKEAGQEALYETLPYRSSDHDGVIVGLNLFGLPTDMTINAGDNQSTTVNTNFPTQLDLTVEDSEGNPVAGAEVTFSGPLSGASASILELGPHLTDSNGNLVVTAVANATAGAYDFVATAGGATATFHLTNLAGAAASITINAGDNQSTTVNSNFPTQLDLTVHDAYNNPVPNATVTFAGPLSGASASIVEAGPHTTNANGNLVVTAHANGSAGSYNFVAMSGSASATFHLTNLLAGYAQLSAGGSSCAAFAALTAPTLTEITYGLSKGKINALSEGTFSYWLRVVAPAGSNTFTIHQSITTANFSVLTSLSNGSNVYRADCMSGLQPTISQSGADITVSFNAPSAGTYYLAVKLSTSPIKGNPGPTPTTVHYQFSTAGVADSTRGFDLKKQ